MDKIINNGWNKKHFKSIKLAYKKAKFFNDYIKDLEYDMGTLTDMVIKLKKEKKVSKQEILERIQNVLNQGVDTESNDSDLLRYDLEKDVIAEQKFNEECG